ncbi:MAG: DNA alkylation repair protein [Rikenellaceae bacterium]|nr:DNA alkylation repair protein [Rikenellaceae bacterium]
MIEILRRLKPQMHGAVVEDMARYGIRYGLSYGVAVPVIRRVAADYASDHPLAEYLLAQEIRELKLAAVYIAQAEKLTPEEMERWADRMSQAEIMEHAANHLFYAAPQAPKVIERWLSSTEPLRLQGALWMAGSRARRELDSEPELKNYLWQAESALPRIGKVPFQPAVYFFLRLSAVSSSLRQAAESVLLHFQDRNLSELTAIAEEVQALLEG